MTDAQKRLATLIKQKQDKLEGKLGLIPFYHHLPKLSSVIPGIFRQSMTTLLASTGTGKSKMSKFCTILIPYWLQKKENLEYKIIYFALEESKDQFIDSIFVLLLNTKYGLEVNYSELNSYTKDALSDDVFGKMAEVSHLVDEILEHVIIIDDQTNPTGLYKTCLHYLRQWGEMEEGVYTPHNPNQQVVVVCDHVSLISREKDNELGITLSQAQAMAKWSTHYCLKYLTKVFGCAVWNVQQTTMTSEGVDNIKTNTLEPSMSDVANNKEIVRDSTLVMALFSPYKNRIKVYRGFDIVRLGDSFVNLGVIKNRYGPTHVNIPLYFDGVTGLYKEISKAEQANYFK